MPDDHADVSAASNIEGAKLQILMRHPYYTDTETGEVTPMVNWMDWSDAKVADEWDCEHSETICSKCADEWGTDWWISVVAPDGTRFALNGHPGLPPL